MNKFYLTTAMIGALLAGCGEKKPVTVEKPLTPIGLTEDKDLETKITGDSFEIISSNVLNRLSKGEMNNEQYSSFLFDQLKQQGVVTGDYWRSNPRYVGSFISTTMFKLNVKQVEGLHQDYYMTEDSPISEKAQQDIDAFKKYDQELGNYLRQRATLFEQDAQQFDSVVRNHIKAHIPDTVHKDRRHHLIGWFQGKYKTEFNIR